MSSLTELPLNLETWSCTFTWHHKHHMWCSTHTFTSDYRRKCTLTWAIHACVGCRQQDCFLFLLSVQCWCVPIRLWEFCARDHCVSISPLSPCLELHRQHGVITGRYGSLHFLSQQQQQHFFLFFSGRACVCTCLGGWMRMMGAWDSTMCLLFTKKCNKWGFQRQPL